MPVSRTRNHLLGQIVMPTRPILAHTSIAFQVLATLLTQQSHSSLCVAQLICLIDTEMPQRAIARHTEISLVHLTSTSHGTRHAELLGGYI